MTIGADDRPRGPSSRKLVIRPAAADDAAPLSAIAAAAKAHWDYPQEWMERWRSELTITPADLGRWTVRVAIDAGGRPLGFAALAAASPRWALEHLWVDPSALGRGVGRALLLDALALARGAGAAGLEIDSDPHAAGFYRRLGGEQVDAVPAPMPGAPDRVLPRFRLDAATS